jgi:hypothetical protein
MNTAERGVTTLSKVIWPMQQMSILSMLIQTGKVGYFSDIEIYPLKRKGSGILGNVDSERGDIYTNGGFV